MKLQSILKNKMFIHTMVFLGLFSLTGYLFIDYKILIFFSVLSFAGSICGSFILVVDNK